MKDEMAEGEIQRLENTYIFWIVAVFFSDGCTLFLFITQSDALKRYLKTPQPAILYEMHVGKESMIKEVVRNV